MRPILTNVPNVVNNGSSPQVMHQAPLNSMAYGTLPPVPGTAPIRSEFDPIEQGSISRPMYNVMPVNFYNSPPFVNNSMARLPAVPAYINPPAYNVFYNSGYYGYHPMQIIPDTQPSGPATIPAAQRGPTVYVGNLTQNIDDMVIRQLLQECGKVVRWSRTTDPSTKKLSIFGFCEFESPLGVMRAVRCLNGLELDGQELVANCEEKVKEGLDQWRLDRKNKLLEENPSKSLQEIETQIEREEIRIQQVTQKIAADWNARAELSREIIEEQPVTLPDLPESETAVNDESQNKTVEEAQSDGKAGKNETNSQINLRREWLESMPSYIDISEALSLSSRAANRIRIWNNRLKEARGDFRKRLQAWERKEEQLMRNVKKKRENLEKAKENPSVVSPSIYKRLIELDLRNQPYYLSLDGGIWEGELSSRRFNERRNMIEKEKEADDNLGDVEEVEESLYEGIENELMQNELIESTPDVVISPVESETEKKEEKEEDNKEDKEENKKEDKNENKKEVDIIVEEPLKEIKEEIVMQATQDESENSKPFQMSLSINATKKQEAPSNIDTEFVHTNLFVNRDDDDEDLSGLNQTKVLSKIETPLHYENRRLFDEAGMTKALNKEFLLEIASKVPKETEELLNYPLNWEILHTYKVLDLKVFPWMKKKIFDMLGEDEPELLSIIADMFKESEQPAPTNIIEELKEFFDDQAETFIIRLWKLLIFEQLRLQQQDQQQNLSKSESNAL